MADLSYFYEEDGETLRTFTNWHSEQSVKDAAQLHRGTRDDLLEALHNAWQESEQWRWFEQYQSWLVQIEDIDQYNDSLEPVFDPDTGEELEPDYAIKPDMPERPVMQSWDDWRVENYEFLRRSAYPPVEDQLGMRYDDETNGTTTWLDIQNEVKARYPKS